MATNECDLDLLVTFETGATLLDHAALCDMLESTIHRSVDVVSRNGLSPIIGPKIVAEALPI